VLHLDAAVTGIWTLSEAGDILELQASAGICTRMDAVHGRVPTGKLNIGMIVREWKPLLINNVLNDPRISGEDWGKTEGLVGFAGYPLFVGNRTIGVLVMLSRKSISAGTHEALSSAADLIAQGTKP